MYLFPGGVFIALYLLLTFAHAVNDGPNYESLPLDTIFPGPWESNIRAPVNKSHITPIKIFNFEGAVSGGPALLQDADANGGLTLVIRPGGLITFEFAENIAGRVCFEVDEVKNSPFLVLAYSESPFFAGREPDATGDRQARDLPLHFSIDHTGLNCVGRGYNRGGFKYLTLYIPEDHVPTEEGFWHDGHTPPNRDITDEKSFWHTASQKFLGMDSQSKGSKSKEPSVSISSIWVNCTAFPSNPNGRAYTGYFDSSSDILNRVWYAGAWTLQLSTLDPQEGGSLIDFNRFFDHNNAPQGAWYSNYTISNGTAVTTDGAKRDRMVWPGDMTIAVPGIAVSTYDMLAVRNALDTIFDHQYFDGSMPYAGPPMGAFGEFSDTYHLHTLLGAYTYVLYSGDLDWIRKRWPAYVQALGISIGKVDKIGLLHVSSIYDWIRPGMTGHNVEASAILFDVLYKSMKLAEWINEPERLSLRGESWNGVRRRLGKGLEKLYCQTEGLYADNIGRRGCNGPEKVLPQDGNSWVLMSNAIHDKRAFNMSLNLRSRWIKYGAPAVEFPNVISPFASSFELLGHNAAGNHDATVELIELMWGYMLDGPGMTNSTLLEGYRVDGFVQYPAYWSAARNSHAHGWAAGPTTALMQGVLGIELQSPLGRTWKIEPHLTKWLSFARGGFATKLGKFEVAMTLMRSLSTGRRLETLNIETPEGTSGFINWGGRSQYCNEQMSGKLNIFRYVDGAAEDGWFMRSLQDEADFVKDDEWVKPAMEEREPGVVDWEALEQGYSYAAQRMPASRPNPNPGDNESLQRYELLLKSLEEENKERIRRVSELDADAFL